jgi:DNA-binding transcriptional regulator YdaS (Cro superfamily)
MDLPTWINNEFGRGKKLAIALGIQPPVVSDWVTGKKAVPAGRCQAIVRLTGGAVTLQELRPDDWANYWPELANSTPAPAAPDTCLCASALPAALPVALTPAAPAAPAASTV